MSILLNVVTLLTADIRTTIISLIIGLIVYKIAKFYVLAFSLPPGPIPLPLLGNILYFRGTKKHWSIELEKVGDKYGPVFTMWLGFSPVVFISDIDIAREAFRKSEFAGRPQSILQKFITDEGSTDIIFADYGQHWESLRRVAHSAIQKYSTTDKLAYLVSDCVDHTIERIIEKEGLNKPFESFSYIHYTFLNIMAYSVFGRRYELDDPEYKLINFNQQDKSIDKSVGIRFFLWEFFPFLIKIDGKMFGKMKKVFEEKIQFMKNKFKSHYKDYDESVVRDFCDTLISAKNDALREGKESAPYLTDNSLTLAILDLFIAGIDTSQHTFKWLLFLMTYYPEVLKKLKEEIKNEIGDRIPTHEDRNRCHYTQAFISETLRHRNIAPNGAVMHRAVVTSKIGEYTIPEGTQVAVFQGHILHKEEYWLNAEEFRPERFLENGKYITTRPKAFIPFGVGRRVCPGEKMALADLFLVLVRFIQKTSDYDLKLHFSGDTEPDPNFIMNVHPHKYEISFNRI